MDKDTNKNLKDTRSPLPNLPLNKGEEQGGGLRYTKISKLITALYMVTDIMDKEEPIRLKLRTLGLEIISDSNLARTVLAKNKEGMSFTIMDQIISLLNIASAMNFISEMNCAILKKEFLMLQESIQVKNNWLEEFLDSPLEGWPKDGVENSSTSPRLKSRYSSRGELNSIGHKGHTRIGVQKGSTLMKALSKFEVSDKIGSGAQNFNTLKKERRDSIINIIKASGGNATIKDIKTNTIAQGFALRNVSEKTLQRELISMIKDGVLNKTGEKRWSRYFVK